MASVGHVLVGLAAAKGYARPSLSGAALFSVLALLPDLDVVAFRFAIPYAAPFGHRGASHSLACAVIVAAVVAAFATRNSRGRVFLFALIAVASHGLLDMCTDGGEGVAIFWPLTPARYFFPWRFVPVSPIGVGFLSARGLWVAVREMLIFAPVWLYLLLLRSDATDETSSR